MIDRYKRFKSKEELKYMKHFGEFLREQRGVSPVIGVILMVAVTVVMGAVIAGFVYGYLGTTAKAPNVALSVIDDPATTGTALLIKHNGGETIPVNEWKCSVTSGKESTTEWGNQTETGGKAGGLSTGTVLTVTKETDGTTAIAAGWYHIVAVHLASDTILLDTNVLVR
jgi:flagellin-like protein